MAVKISLKFAFSYFWRVTLRETEEVNDKLLNRKRKLKIDNKDIEDGSELTGAKRLLMLCTVHKH